jgi:hypothetical protein
MPVSAPCPADHPLMIAWTAYKQTEENRDLRNEFNDAVMEASRLLSSPEGK